MANGCEILQRSLFDRSDALRGFRPDSKKIHAIIALYHNRTRCEEGGGSNELNCDTLMTFRAAILLRWVSAKRGE